MMAFGPNESLEDYEEIFELNYRRANYTLYPDSRKLFLLQGMTEDVMETLNILSGGDINQFPCDEIKIVFVNNSKVVTKKGRSRKSLVNSSPSTIDIKHEIDSMLEHYKSEMLHKFSLQIGTMKIKRW